MSADQISKRIFEILDGLPFLAKEKVEEVLRLRVQLAQMNAPVPDFYTAIEFSPAELVEEESRLWTVYENAGGAVSMNYVYRG